MANIFHKFRDWFAARRNFLFSYYAKDTQETQEPESSLIELPTEIRSRLTAAVNELPINPAEKGAIASALDEAYQLWSEDKDEANNSLAILSSPVDSVSRILSTTLEEWAEQKDLNFKLLPLTARPLAVESILPKLEHYLENQAQKMPESAEIIVIPNLSWCFLRSLEGLEGIEYLQHLLCANSNKRFWIIGGERVGWEYLNSVCALEAYCDKVFDLPGISPEDLQDWFEPIIQEFQITFGQPRIDQQILDGDKNKQTSYFEHLADISQGVSTVAIQAFLKSIHYQRVEQNEAESVTENLIAQTPTLPKLPSFDSEDQYLLYSLLLHGDLTIAALAESLGDLESEVQARVQVLRRNGIVKQQQQTLKINPIYYPRLKQKLASNNFIISRP